LYEIGAGKEGKYERREGKKKKKRKGNAIMGR